MSLNEADWKVGDSETAMCPMCKETTWRKVVRLDTNVIEWECEHCESIYSVHFTPNDWMTNADDFPKYEPPDNS